MLYRTSSWLLAVLDIGLFTCVWAWRPRSPQDSPFHAIRSDRPAEESLLETLTQVYQGDVNSSIHLSDLIRGDPAAEDRPLLLLLDPQGQHRAQHLAPDVFEGVLKEVDKKFETLRVDNVPHQHCAEMAQQVSQAPLATSLSTQDPLIIHTGAFLAGSDLSRWKDAPRKLRLNLLSVLATQDLSRTKVMWWSDVDLSNPYLKEAFAPILAKPDLAKVLDVKKFDAPAEYKQAFPGRDGMADFFVQLYQKDGMLGSRSDLQRIVLLNNYGGIWMDIDVVALSDFAPLAHKDWAYLGQSGFINGAILGTESKHSPFMKAYMAKIASKFHEEAKRSTNYFEFGPTLLAGLHSNSTTKNVFHILPPCFFDGGWEAQHMNAPDWDHFFTGKATPGQIEFIAPEAGAHQAFAYHWHNRWDKPIDPSSVAAEAEKHLVTKLDLKV